MSTKTIRLDCDCVGRCSILCVDFEDWDDGEPQTWHWDFYTNSGYDGSWRHRLRVIWNLLRGKDHYFHGTVHTIEEMRFLRAFLDQTLPRMTYPMPAVVATGGVPVTYKIVDSDA